MIRVLQSVNIMDRAGLETMLMNYYRNIDRSVVQFDFLTHRPQDGAYDDEIRSLGGNVFHAPRLYPQNLPEYDTAEHIALNFVMLALPVFCSDSLVEHRHVNSRIFIK